MGKPNGHQTRFPGCAPKVCLIIFHLLKHPGKNMSSSDKFPLKPTRENTKHTHLKYAGGFFIVCTALAFWILSLPSTKLALIKANGSENPGHGGTLSGLCAASAPTSEEIVVPLQKVMCQQKSTGQPVTSLPKLTGQKKSELFIYH